MADKSDPGSPVPIPPLSEVGSAFAPIIFFDTTSAHGFNNPIVTLSLEAVRMVSGLPEPSVKVDRVIVAHLRTTIHGAVALRNALNDALLMAHPAESEAKN